MTLALILVFQHKGPTLPQVAGPSDPLNFVRSQSTSETEKYNGTDGGLGPLRSGFCNYGLYSVAAPPEKVYMVGVG